MMGEVAVDGRSDFRRVDVVGADERDILCLQVVEVSVQQELSVRKRVHGVDAADMAHVTQGDGGPLPRLASRVWQRFAITSPDRSCQRGPEADTICTGSQFENSGPTVARCTVQRLMGELGLAGAVRGRAWITTTVPDTAAVRPSDLVERSFVAQRPNQLWVSDFTYVATWHAVPVDALHRSLG